MPSPFVAWDVLAVTAQTVTQAKAFQAELRHRKKLGALPGIGKDTIIVAVSDPHPQSSSPWDASAAVGSGGATLNAVLSVAEQMSARSGTGTLDASVLQKNRVLIVHNSTCRAVPAMGGVGKAFSTLPVEDPDAGGLVSNIDIVLKNMEVWVGDAAPGVWVCSTEFFMTLPEQQTPLQWGNGITAVALPTTVEFGTKHGVYKIGDGGGVDSIHYQASEAELQSSGCIGSDGHVSVVAPIVRFSADAAELLLGLYASAPLDGCTSYGYDAGGSAVPVNLYLDILAACTNDMTEAKYLTPPPGTPPTAVFSTGARELIWKTFNKVQLTALVPPCSAGKSAVAGGFCYISNTADYVSFMTDGPLWPASEGDGAGLPGASKQAYGAIEPGTIEPTAVVFNAQVSANVPYTGLRAAAPAEPSQLGPKCVVEHSRLLGCTVGAGALVSGLSGVGMTIAPGHAVQQFRLIDGDSCIVTYGVDDDLFCVPPATYCGQPWAGSTAAQQVGIWSPSVPEEKRSLLYAEIFVTEKTNTPISLARCIATTSVQAELDWRRELSWRVDMEAMRTSLSNSGCGPQTPCLLPACARLALNKSSWAATLKELDEITIAFADQPHLVSRALATQADVLAAFAGVEGGLRSGPARNEAWAPALKSLTSASLAFAVKALAGVRDDWLDSPERLMRAARHYEAAAAKLIGRCVETASKFITYTAAEPTPVGEWVCTTSPARIDLAGGWTDTPPVSYEYGGVVVNAAILVDGKRALEARVRRTAEPGFNLKYDGQDKGVEVLTMDDIMDYSHPLASAALLKTAMLCVGLVDMNDEEHSLQEQLEKTLGGGGAKGLEVITASRLPMGSGLGGSSVLSGVLLHAVGVAVGRQYDTSSLVHAVLKLEQMLSSGGGWQDQVGGMYPGLKVCRSPAALPLKVATDPLVISPDVISKLNEHLVLCYSGQARLARNLLQGVLRRWFGRLPEVVGTVSSLVSNAEAIQPAAISGDIEAFGACVSAYWSQKKLMAGCGVEPTLVTRAFAAMAPLLCGHTMAGAGGGGFILLVTKEPNDQASLQAVLDSVPEFHIFSLHECTIDTDGMSTSRGGDGTKSTLD